MGSRCRLVIGGGDPGLIDRIRALIEELEQAWSRFRPDSEISALNQRAGQLTIVSDPVYQLISRAETGRQRTGGLFNPLMLDQLEGQGYRHSFERGIGLIDQAAARPASPEPLGLFPEVRAVLLPEGTRFDPGGIGKGLAADLAVERCLAEGATTVSIELGGDLRVAGEPWYGPSWDINVADPFNREAVIGTLTPEGGGAVTTSTTLIKRWDDAERTYHHLLDPATGRSAETDLVAVTTCGGEAWWAEVVAKCALISGSERALDLLADLHVPGLAVTTDGGILGAERPAVSAGREGGMA